MIRPKGTFVERDFLLFQKWGEIIQYPTNQSELTCWGFTNDISSFHRDFERDF